MASAPCLNDETLATFLSDPDAISLIDEPAFDWAVDAAFRRYVDVVAVTDPQARAMATAFADHPAAGQFTAPMWVSAMVGEVVAKPPTHPVPTLAGVLVETSTLELDGVSGTPTLDFARVA